MLGRAVLFCRAFLSLFLKFYLLNTPHRRNAKHFGEGSVQEPLKEKGGNFISRKQVRVV